MAQAANPSGRLVDVEQPFVLVAAAAGGPRVTVLNEAADAAGLTSGEPLSDARAKTGFLQVRPLDAAVDAAALRHLTLWATRYTPTASPWGEDNGADGFFLDIEGAAHLFGGEERLIADLAQRLEGFGLRVRLAIAATPGAAWALSRFHETPLIALPSGQEAEAFAPLPIEALRLSPETSTMLHRLGFKTIGSLLDKPRAPFAARFSAELLRRLDQALGRVEEPLVPIVAPPVYHSLRYLLEPIFTQEAVVSYASRLMQALVHVLERDDKGARAIKLSLYRVDGAVETIDIGLTLPTRSIAHVSRLIELKLEALGASENAGFGFEAVGLAITHAESMSARQTELTSAMEEGGQAEDCAALIDKLRQRLGPQSVRRFAAVESHIPERAEMLAPVTDSSSPVERSETGERNRAKRGGRDVAQTMPPPPCYASSPSPATRGRKDSFAAEEEQTRPLLLLPQAEPAEEVMALAPDGPPRRFCWRGITYDVKRAQGPERISAEWWRAKEQKPEPTRDYFLLEDADGRRFWLYCEGLCGRETNAARWFVHGLFA